MPNRSRRPARPGYRRSRTPRGRSRRPARAPRPPLASLLLTVAVLAAGVSGVVLLLQWQPEEAVQAAPAGEPTTPAEVRRVALIVDPSGSNGGPAEAARALVMTGDAVARWYGQPPQSRRPSEPYPGLDLHIRTVATNSYGPRAELLHVELPPVAGLNPPPDPSDALATSAWAKASDGVDAGWRDGQALAVAAAEQVRRLQPPSLDSEIVGAVSAAGAVMGSGPGTIVLISDLEQIGAPQVAGDLAGKRLVVFQRCNGDAARCAQAFSDFEGMAGRWGVEAIEVHRSEVLGSKLSTILAPS